MNVHSKNFSPNLHVNILPFWKKKKKSLLIYKSELRKYPHSRSVDAVLNLAKQRGNQVGLKMAESFEVIRNIIF